MGTGNLAMRTVPRQGHVQDCCHLMLGAAALNIWCARVGSRSAWVPLIQGELAMRVSVGVMSTAAIVVVLAGM